MVHTIHEELLCPVCRQKHLYEGIECLNDEYKCKNSGKSFLNNNRKQLRIKYANMYFANEYPYIIEDNSIVISTRSAADFLGYNLGRIYYRLNTGKIAGSHEKKGSPWKIDGISVIRYKEGHQNLMYTKDVAEKLGITVEKARFLLKTGKLMSYKEGRIFICVDPTII